MSLVHAMDLPAFSSSSFRTTLQQVFWLLNWVTVVSFNTINLEWTKATRGPNQELDEYYYTEAIFMNLKSLDNWNFEALETINRNMMTQHSEMRRHLQDRHQDMVTDIVEVIEDSTNVLGNEFTRTNAWIQKVACETLALTGTECPTDDDGALLDPQDWPETSMKLWGEIQAIKDQGVSSASKVDEMEKEMQRMTEKMQGMTEKMTELIQMNKKLMEALEATK